MSTPHLPPDTAVIDEYVAAVGARLAGPADLRAELLAEVYGGLVDAAEAYARRGACWLAAQRAAVGEFGTVDELCEDFQRVLEPSGTPDRGRAA